MHGHLNGQSFMSIQTLRTHFPHANEYEENEEKENNNNNFSLFIPRQRVESAKNENF